jgi:predicted RNase H-like nuclease (RuvC/YqgF family)
MSVLEIALSILNTITGGGLLLSLLTLRQQRRKATTEVNKDNVELVNLTVNSMIQNVNLMMAQNKELREILDTKVKENEELIKRIDSLDKKVCSMIRTNKEVLKVLEKLNIDEAIMNMIKSGLE